MQLCGSTTVRDASLVRPVGDDGRSAPLPRDDFALSSLVTISYATALLGHADEGTAIRHYVECAYVAPDLWLDIDQLVQHASVEAPQAKTE